MSSMTGDPLGEEGVGKIPNIPDGLWFKKCWCRGEEVRAD